LIESLTVMNASPPSGFAGHGPASTPPPELELVVAVELELVVAVELELVVAVELELVAAPPVPPVPPVPELVEVEDGATVATVHSVAKALASAYGTPTVRPAQMLFA
jgi:hypothetical protein